MDLNRVELTGVVLDNPKFNVNKENGTKYCRFQVATIKKWRDPKGQNKESRDTHNCVAWGKTAKLLNEMIVRNMRVHLIGELKMRTYEKEDFKRSFVEVNVSQFEVLAYA